MIRDGPTWSETQPIAGTRKATRTRIPRAPVEVGRQPVGKPDAAPPQGGQDQEESDGGQDARARADRLRAHRSTRWAWIAGLSDRYGDYGRIALVIVELEVIFYLQFCK